MNAMLKYKKKNRKYTTNMRIVHFNLKLIKIVN